MGFFADIIRDSRRGGMAAHSTEAPLSRGKEVSTDAPAAAEVGAVASDAGDTSVIRLREEGGGQPVTARQDTVQSGTVTRQVVGPSPSEHTPAAGIPEVSVKGAVLPNPVKREPAGCESGRTETGFRVEQMESFHDGGSIDVPAVSVSASESFVRESSSGYTASRTGKVSVETQGRQQAGETRAGSPTTPPEQLTGEAAGNMVQRADDVLPDAPLSTHRAMQTSQPSILLNETSRPLGGESFAAETPHESLPDIPATTAVISPLPEPPAFPRGADERGSDRSLPPEPQVRIGTIEVVVVAPTPAERPPRSEERTRPDLASRNYLRNF